MLHPSPLDCITQPDKVRVTTNTHLQTMRLEADWVRKSNTPQRSAFRRWPTVRHACSMLLDSSRWLRLGAYSGISVLSWGNRRWVSRLMVLVPKWFMADTARTWAGETDDTLLECGIWRDGSASHLLVGDGSVMHWPRVAEKEKRKRGGLSEHAGLSKTKDNEWIVRLGIETGAQQRYRDLTSQSGQ
ncbi:hypothetical protein CONLIGDRAFT_374433 [Coniochaeta ligniaria NRRL 30616]|uniref:Uncharacterized protein n=1 Tax=Coniochaeta ligniaria NRRL 30616 TaxID=1408157 RepID=A0A1J7JGI6_9PEZI|nr:hypothetical protein CONLIGDRAFT_374433 [Coniochaeta ligniaria NRRL 30616]